MFLGTVTLLDRDILMSVKSFDTLFKMDQVKDLFKKKNTHIFCHFESGFVVCIHPIYQNYVFDNEG